MEAGVGGDDLGFAVVDEVVLGTEQAEAVDVGEPASGPPVDVVDLAPLGSGVAGDTALISGDHRQALCRCCEPRRAAEPQGLTLGIEDGGDDVGFTRKPRDFLGRAVGVPLASRPLLVRPEPLS